jgi:hypothetical protein
MQSGRHCGGSTDAARAARSCSGSAGDDPTGRLRWPAEPSRFAAESRRWGRQVVAENFRQMEHRARHRIWRQPVAKTRATNTPSRGASCRAGCEQRTRPRWERSAQVARQFLHDCFAPPQLRLPLDDGLPDVPVQQNQLAVHRTRGRHSCREDASFELGDEPRVVGAGGSFDDHGSMALRADAEQY